MQSSPEMTLINLWTVIYFSLFVPIEAVHIILNLLPTSNPFYTAQFCTKAKYLLEEL